MGTERAKQYPLEALGKLPFETALEHVCRDVPVFARRITADEARRALSERRFDLVSHTAVCEGTI